MKKLIWVVGMIAAAAAVWWLVDVSQQEPIYLPVTELPEPESAEVESGEYRIHSSDYIEPGKLLEDRIEGGTLTDAELAGLLIMREEEKLARDVYTTLGKVHRMRIFSNIAASEQTHMDAMAYLLELYDVDDPVTDDSIGAFTNPNIKLLHDDLVEQGMKSPQAALIVGATIEDLDIFDLERFLKETDKEDIRLTYKNLQKGSRNHLRAFVRQIERQGSTYEAQYISNEVYESIINSEQESEMIQ
jgi:hypothetical protein